MTAKINFDALYSRICLSHTTR